ncbi:MAG: hypothetical protein ABR597_13290 [Bacteroidales bacterium]
MLKAAAYPLDGVDLAPVLFRNDTLADRDLYWIWGQRTNRWALRYNDWKIVKFAEGQPEKPEDWGLNLLADLKEEIVNRKYILKNEISCWKLEVLRSICINSVYTSRRRCLANG